MGSEMCIRDSLMLLACSRARNSGSRSFLRCRSAASSARPSTPENMGLECFFTLPRPRRQPRRPTIKEFARQTSHTTRPYPCPVPARISVSLCPHGGAPGFKRYQIGRFSPMCNEARPLQICSQLLKNRNLSRLMTSDTEGARRSFLRPRQMCAAAACATNMHAASQPAALYRSAHGAAPLAAHGVP